jgi:hypothetical protein
MSEDLAMTLLAIAALLMCASFTLFTLVLTVKLL